MINFNLSILRSRIRKLCFLIIVIAVFIVLLNSIALVIRKRTSTSIRWDNFYKLTKEENLDILMFGSSHSYTGLNPKIFEEQLKLNSYNLSNSAQVITQTYYNMVEAFKYTKPKLAIIETNFIDQSDLIEDRWYFAYEELASMEWSMNKARYIMDLFTPRTYFNAVFPAIREHDNWADKKILYDNVKYLDIGLNNVNSYIYKGYIQRTSVLSGPNIAKYKTLDYQEETYVINEKCYDAVSRMVQLCKENDCRVIMVKTALPKVLTEKMNYMDRYNATKQVADQLGVEYIDFNLLYDQLGFTDEYFMDEFNETGHHLNVKGAAVTSQYLADHIRTNYPEILPSMEEIILWEQKNIPDPRTFTGFFRTLDQSKLVILSVKDEGSTGITEEAVLAMKDAGLVSDLRNHFRYSYGAVFIPRTLIGIEALQKEKVTIEYIKGDKIEDFELPINLKIVSGGRDYGNVSSVIINGNEYSLNGRGMNVVVYDLIEKKVVKSVNFDTFLPVE